MADYTLFTNPMSRGQIARWALHEAGADYDTQLVEWDDRPQALLDANPIDRRGRKQRRPVAIYGQ